MGYYSEWQLLVVGNSEQLSEFQAFVEDQAGDPSDSAQYYSNRFAFFRMCWDEQPVSLSGGRVGLRYATDRDKCYSPGWGDFLSVLFTYLKAGEFEYSLVRVGEACDDIEIAHSEDAVWLGHPRLTIDNPFELAEEDFSYSIMGGS